MKERIIKVTETRYGKKEAEWYDVQYYKRDWSSIILSLIFPIIGWFYFFQFKPYQLEWRTDRSFDKLVEAKYYLKNEDICDTKIEVLKNSGK